MINLIIGIVIGFVVTITVPAVYKWGIAKWEKRNS